MTYFRFDKQVCIPDLHLSLGIFNWLWNLLEDACSELDFKLAMACIDTASNSPFDTTALKKLSLMRIELDTERNYANVITEMITFYTLTGDDASDMCESLKEDLATAQQCISNKVPNKHCIHVNIL